MTCGLGSGVHLKCVCSHDLRHALNRRRADAQVEQIEDPLEPATEIVRRCEQKQLMALYKVGAYSGAEDLLRQIAQARGKLKAGGVPVVDVCCSNWPSRIVHGPYGMDSTAIQSVSQHSEYHARTRLCNLCIFELAP